MTVYTVHAKQPSVDADTLASTMVLVPEKFSFAAFLLGPIWLLFHRLWISFLLWVIAAGVILTMLLLADTLHQFTISYFFSALLLGFEANALRRRELQLRGYALVDVTSGGSKEEGERRYLDRALQENAVKTTDNSNRRPANSSPTADQNIGGLIDLGARS